MPCLILLMRSRLFFDCEEQSRLEEEHALPPDFQHQGAHEAAQSFMDAADEPEPEASSSDISPQRGGEGPEEPALPALRPLPIASEEPEPLLVHAAKRVRLLLKQEADRSVYRPRNEGEAAAEPLAAAVPTPNDKAQDLCLHLQ